MRDRLIVHPLSTGTASLAEDVALARSLGLSRASVAMHKVAGAGGPDAAAAILRHSGLAVDIVHPSGSLDLADPSGWAPACDAVLEAGAFAARVGATRVLFAGGAAHGLLWEQAAEAFERALGPALVELGRVGVRPLIEPVRVQFAFAGFVHTLRDGVALARQVGRGLGVGVDVTHCWWEPGLARTLADNVDLVGTVHLADLHLDRPVTSRVVPGDGDLPLDAFLAALRSAGYGGPLELELIGPAIDAEGPAAAMARAVAYLCAAASEPPAPREPLEPPRL